MTAGAGLYALALTSTVLVLLRLDLNQLCQCHAEHTKISGIYINVNTTYTF